MFSFFVTYSRREQPLVNSLLISINPGAGPFQLNLPLISIDSQNQSMTQPPYKLNSPDHHDSKTPTLTTNEQRDAWLP
jgi:hypothetical protein